MELNQVIHGFKIERIRKSEELKGTLYEMRHIKTGAELAFLDNKEVNKLFSVAFKTLPWDDTGVFHILEHSVLAGSENFPVKEPFLDLLKSSMNTFLNAMTFPDKTMYPVSSRNEQDFINLVTVYLDAVFKPAIYTNESIFRQEGWHYEVNDGVPSYNGVVFNEMKGALSNVFSLAEHLALKYLYPDSIYGFESGGDPKSIPDLTYKNFLKAHSEFYSPSNAKFYLDGAVPLERVLELIDGKYLSSCEFVDKKHEIALQPPIEKTEKTEYYEIGEDEPTENKTHISLSKVFATWEDKKRIASYSLIASYLADTNESPLKRAVLEKGLARDVDFYINDGIAQPFYMLVFKNTEPDKKDDLMSVFTSVLNKILEEGIDKEELIGHINRFEFNLREGEEPRGLTRNIEALNSWLYGGDMLLYLENDELLKDMRAGVESGYYESIIKELLDLSGTLTLVMLPSKTKGTEDRKAEENRVTGEYNSLTEEEKKRVQKVYDDMRLWQDTPDSPEAVATLPVLSLSDVEKTPLWLDTQEESFGKTKVLFHKLNTNGIVHCNMFFSIADEGYENLQALSVLSDLLSVLPTEKHTSAELHKEINKTIGTLDFIVDSYSDLTNPQIAKPYFSVSFSALESNLEPALALVREILLETVFDRKDLIKENILQASENLYQALMSSGHIFALRRTLSATSASSRINEFCKGYDFLVYLRDFAKNFDEKVDSFVSYVRSAAKSVFASSRLIVSETAESKHTEIKDFVSSLPEGEIQNSALSLPVTDAVKEAILIPSGVSYASYGANILNYGYPYEGKFTVTSLILTYGYLWNEIRVHGGAYGCGFRSGITGSTSFYSYRDPSPINSLEVYKNTGDFIREFVSSDEKIDRYIISSIAVTEPLQSTSKQGFEADTNYLMGYTREDKQKARTQMLNLKKEELLSLCDLFEKMKNGNSVCIIGNADSLKDLPPEWKKYRA